MNFEIIRDMQSFGDVPAPLPLRNFAFLAQLDLHQMTLIGLSPSMQQAEEFEWKNRVSGFPLESGSEISDHMVCGPLVISQKFVVTALPMYGVSAAPQLAPIVFMLTELRNKKQMIDVLTSYARYPNMVIESLRGVRTEGCRDCLECDIVFREIPFADTEESTVSATRRNQKVINTRNKTFNLSAAAPVSGNVSCSRIAGGVK
jgi:hypothetical protein